MGERSIYLSSTIDGAGRGLFAACSFGRGEIITEYGGRVLDKIPLEKAGEAGIDVGHFKNLDRVRSIDGKFAFTKTIPGECFKGLAQFANNPNRKDQVNTAFRDYYDRQTATKHVTLVAARDIMAGEELFAQYKMLESPSSEYSSSHKAKKKHVAQLKPFQHKVLRLSRDPIRSERARKRKRGTLADDAEDDAPRKRLGPRRALSLSD